MREFALSVLIFLCSLIAASGEKQDATKNAAEAAQPIDKKATAETREVFSLLRRLAADKVLFGHQDSTAYGVGWSGGWGKSDVKEVTSSFPAIYGWDIGQLGREKNLDGIEFYRLQKLIVNADSRGGINTISWHMDNPVTGRRYLDRRARTNNVKEVMPGGSHHEQLKRRLDMFAEFMSELKDEKGRPIPIIFRPWHENNQQRFWWAVRADGADYISLWRFTVEYLRDKKSLHNLLYAYSPLSQDYLREKNPARYSDPKMGYPGDAWVDVLGIDDYSGRGKTIRDSARLVSGLANVRGKIGALTEVGPGNGLSSDKGTSFFTEQLLAPVKDDPSARKVAYVLVWRNKSSGHFWVPFKGHPDEANFVKFRKDPFTVFEDDLPREEEQR